MGKSTENTDLENICRTRPNVEPAVEQVTTYIKSGSQNEILTASIAQEIEADGNLKKGGRIEAASTNEETRGKAKG